MSLQYPELETKQSEMRPTQRVHVNLSGRCMAPSRAEHQCRTTKMSPDDMLVVAPVRVEKGDKIVVYLETLGRFAGVVSLQTSMGFELALQLPPMKREKLVSQLEWFANRDALDLPEKRHHERIVPLSQLSVLRLHTGREHIVKINDISRDGANRAGLANLHSLISGFSA